MIRALGVAAALTFLLAGCTITQVSDKLADDPPAVAAVRSSHELHWDLTGDNPIDAEGIWVVSGDEHPIDVELTLPSASFTADASDVSIMADGERLTTVVVFESWDDAEELRDALLAQEPSYGWGADQVEGWYEDTAAASVNSTNSRVRVNMNGVSGDWDVSVELNRKSGESAPITAMYTFYLP
jgi:hypothetical protein